MNEQELARIAELWDRQQRHEGPGENATPKERHYYSLIEQVLSPGHEFQDLIGVASSSLSRYKIHPG